MNYLFFTVLLASATVGANQQAQQFSQAQQEALDKAKEAVRKYHAKAACQEYRNFVIYMESAYRSWYQAVNPRIDLREKLTNDALALVDTLKTIVKPFERTPQYPLGGSRLSDEGEQLYQDLIVYAKAQPCLNFKQLPETRYR